MISYGKHQQLLPTAIGNSTKSRSKLITAKPRAAGYGGVLAVHVSATSESKPGEHGMYEPSDSMSDVPGELRRICRFTLRGLLFAVMACAIETAAFIYSSPFWLLTSVVVLAAIVGVSAHRLNRVCSARRAARNAIIVIGSVGFIHLAIARHPWTGSWLLRLNYNEAIAGNGWFALFGASRVGIVYALCWTIAALVAGSAVGLVVATKNRTRR